MAEITFVECLLCAGHNTLSVVYDLQPFEAAGNSFL